MSKPQEFKLFDYDFSKLKLHNKFDLFYFYNEDDYGNFSLHTHEFIEIIFIIRGNISMSVEDTKYKLKKGDIIVIPDNFIHFTIIDNQDERYERFVVHLKSDYLKKIRGTYNLKKEQLNFFAKPFVINTNIWKSKLVFEDIFSAFQENDELSNALLEASIDQLLFSFSYQLKNDKNTIKPTYNKIVSEAVDYINHNYKKSDLCLDMISQNLNYSIGYLSRIFKKQIGTSIYDFIIYKRLENAKTLINNGESIMDACIKSGFSDYSSFLKSFKNYFNITPSKFKNLEKA